jgi:hypothetical protein
VVVAAAKWDDVAGALTRDCGAAFPCADKPENVISTLVYLISTRYRKNTYNKSVATCIEL